MATPLGHSLVAGLLYFSGNRTYRVDLPLLLVYGLFANGPDLDFLPGIIVGNPSAFHHGISHSLGFGILFTLVVSVILTRTWKRFAEFGFLRLILVGYLLYASHLLVDFMTLDNTAPFGQPIFWPVFQQYIHAPVYIFPNVLHSHDQFSLHNVNVALREILIFAPLTAYLMVSNQKRSVYTKRLVGLALTIYVGIVVALFTRSNPYF